MWLYQCSEREGGVLTALGEGVSKKAQGRILAVTHGLDQALAVVNQNLNILVHPFAQNPGLSEITGFKGTEVAEISPSSRFAIFGGQLDVIGLYDLKRKVLVNRFHVPFDSGDLSSLCFVRDERHFASASRGGKICLYSIQSADPSSEYWHGDQGTHVYQIRASSLQKNIYASCGGDGTIFVWDAMKQGFSFGMQFETEQPVTCLSFSPSSSSFLFSGGLDKHIRIVDLNSKKAVKRIQMNAAVTSLSVSGDGKYLVSGMEDGSTTIHDLRKLNASSIFISPPMESGAVTAVRVLDNLSTSVFKNPGSFLPGTSSSRASSPCLSERSLNDGSGWMSSASDRSVMKDRCEFHDKENIKVIDRLTPVRKKPTRSAWKSYDPGFLSPNAATQKSYGNAKSEKKVSLKLEKEVNASALFDLISQLSLQLNAMKEQISENHLQILSENQQMKDQIRNLKMQIETLKHLKPSSTFKRSSEQDSD